MNWKEIETKFKELDEHAVYNLSQNQIIDFFKKYCTPKSSKIKFNFREAMIDYGFDADLTDQWLEVRKAKKGINTQTAFKLFIKELEKRNIPNINAILEFIISKSWSGFSWGWIDNIIAINKNNYNNDDRINTIAAKIYNNKI